MQIKKCVVSKATKPKMQRLWSVENKTNIMRYFSYKRQTDICSSSSDNAGRLEESPNVT